MRLFLLINCCILVLCYLLYTSLLFVITPLYFIVNCSINAHLHPKGLGLVRGYVELASLSVPL